MNKIKRVVIYLSQEEHKLLRDQAKKAGKIWSAYLHDIVMNHLNELKNKKCEKRSAR